MEWTDDQPTQEGWYWFRVFLENFNQWRNAEVCMVCRVTFQGHDGKPERKMSLFPAQFQFPFILDHYCRENRVQWCRIPIYETPVLLLWPR